MTTAEKQDGVEATCRVQGYQPCDPMSLTRLPVGSVALSTCAQWAERPVIVLHISVFFLALKLFEGLCSEKNPALAVLTF